MTVFGFRQVSSLSGWGGVAEGGMCDAGTPGETEAHRVNWVPETDSFIMKVKRNPGGRKLGREMGEE